MNMFHKGSLYRGTQRRFPPINTLKLNTFWAIHAEYCILSGAMKICVSVRSA